MSLAKPRAAIRRALLARWRGAESQSDQESEGSRDITRSSEASAPLGRVDIGHAQCTQRPRRLGGATEPVARSDEIGLSHSIAALFFTPSPVRFARGLTSDLVRDEDEIRLSATHPLRHLVIHDDRHRLPSTTPAMAASTSGR